MGRHVEVSFREEQLLKILAEKKRKGYGDPVKATADELRLAKHTVYSTLHRIRSRYRASLDFGAAYRKWRRLLGDKYL